MTFPDYLVTVIIVTHNSSRVLADCLDSIKAATRGISCQTIVVDNNSSDHSATIASRSVPAAAIITNRANVGFAAACNQGAAAATGKFLMFLNPDVRADSDSIRELLSVFEGSEPIGLAGARLRYPGGMFQPSCRRFPSLKNLIYSRGSALPFLDRILRRRRDNPYTLPDYDRTTIVEAVAGTMVMIRSSLFNRIGRFDERFFMYMEDTDLCLRLNRAGYVNLFVPQAGAIHYWREGSSSGQIKRTWYHHRSTWRYFRKHFPDAGTMVLLALMLAANLSISFVRALFTRKTV